MYKYTTLHYATLITLHYTNYTTTTTTTATTTTTTTTATTTRTTTTTMTTTTTATATATAARTDKMGQKKCGKHFFGKASLLFAVRRLQIGIQSFSISIDTSQ